MNKFIDKYKSDLNNKKIIYDIKQNLVAKELGKLYDIIVSKFNQSKLKVILSKFSFLRINRVYGLYIWGSVGRGKTYLVDLFYSSLPINKKNRLHFYHFMEMIHKSLKKLHGNKNPLDIIAKNLSKTYIIICLDEFFVKDIGDAMILSNIFYYIFKYNIILVITSNVIPSNLYYNGLQRQKFMTTVYLIENKLNIISIDNDFKDNIDYRLRHSNYDKTYLYPLSISNFKIMKNMFFSLSKIEPKKSIFIKIMNRKILVVYLSNSSIWFDFDILCGSGRSQLDYIKIAALFNNIFISGLKQLKLLNDDKARRFISLVDELYDKKINLIIMSDSKMTDMYMGENLKFDFQRTYSRLTEMNSKFYITKKLYCI